MFHKGAYANSAASRPPRRHSVRRSGDYPAGTVVEERQHRAVDRDRVAQLADSRRSGQQIDLEMVGQVVRVGGISDEELVIIGVDAVCGFAAIVNMISPPNLISRRS